VIENLPKTGRLAIDIKVTADVNVSAYAARKKVDALILSNVSYMMHAREAPFIIGDRICWRVLVILSLAKRGDVGEVGVIDVDVETGQLYITPHLITEMYDRAECFARRTVAVATSCGI
jgi:hypothetical protein